MPVLGDPTRAPGWLPSSLRDPWDDGSAAIERTLKRMRQARRITPDGRMGLPYEPLTLCSEDGVRLAAWWVPAAPEAPSRGGLVAILHHHYGGQKATVLPWIDVFHRLGVPCLAFDARGHAGSEPSPPGRGSFIKRAADVRAALVEVRRRGAGRILAFGQSQGGASLVIGVAGEGDVVGVILDSGPAPDMASAAWGLSGNMLRSIRVRDPFTQALLSLRIVTRTEPLRYLPSLWGSLSRLRSRPLLWLHGGRDDVIHRGGSATWFQVLRPPGGRWQRILVPDAEHVRTLAMGGAALEQRIAAFVDGL